jgi:hypothetical protein
MAKDQANLSLCCCLFENSSLLCNISQWLLRWILQHSLYCIHFPFTKHTFLMTFLTKSEPRDLTLLLNLWMPTELGIVIPENTDILYQEHTWLLSLLSSPMPLPLLLLLLSLLPLHPLRLLHLHLHDLDPMNCSAQYSTTVLVFLGSLFCAGTL